MISIKFIYINKQIDKSIFIINFNKISNTRIFLVINKQCELNSNPKSDVPQCLGARKASVPLITEKQPQTSTNYIIFFSGTKQRNDKEIERKRDSHS